MCLYEFDFDSRKSAFVLHALIKVISLGLGASVIFGGEISSSVVTIALASLSTSSWSIPLRITGSFIKHQIFYRRGLGFTGSAPSSTALHGRQ